ncbi:alanine/glycine:cation symporter family protein [Oceanicaulis sp. LC35]|uniref:alanine/glycine:cation symporter family protein n=1 Tax=Oceanicaulis sp. LC35 TaxID=3349635 RepID=UPI003F84417D
MGDLFSGLDGLINNVSNFIWGGTWGDAQVLPLGFLAVVLLGTGLYYMIRLGGRPILRFFPALKELWAGRKSQGEDGDITPWQALSTALSGQVGTGNLAGVATAISLGGPGAIFWMWITALLGMACAFAESSLAVKYRETHPDGRIHGGPMFYIKNGLNKGRAGFGGWFGWLAMLFCIGTLISAVATGGMIQANSITESVIQTGNELNFAIPTWGVGLVLAALVFLVIVGGIKSIGSVAGKVVPFMALFYVAVALVVIIINIVHVPEAFGLIFSHAFGWHEAVGGAAGYGVMQAVRYGVARGLFSNEAGQGSAPIAHAAAQTKSPVAQGEIAMIGVFIDTIVICTMTALVILVAEGSYPAEGGGVVSYAWQSSLNSSAITTAAFASAIPGGQFVITVALALFAFTTIIGWSYYAQQAASYLFGDWVTNIIRYVWVLIVFAGCLVIDTVTLWRFGDIANASMAFPNLIAILLLSGAVATMAREADDKVKRGESII